LTTRKRKTTPASPAPEARKQSAPETQAERHRRIRDDHSVEIAEDYVELIAQLIAEHGEARTVDIARRLGVSHVTVTKTVGRLQKEGLVRTQPYRSIFLTDTGADLAARSASRHDLIVAFLRRLGVDGPDAETDAEGIEHHVSDATLEAMRRVVEADE
jgi:DtxR family manganese transport transcriptional regulator